MKLLASLLGGIVVYLSAWLLTQWGASHMHQASSEFAMFLAMDGIIIMQIVGFALAGFSSGRIAGRHGLLLGFVLALAILLIFHFTLFANVPAGGYYPLHIPVISVLCCTIAAGLGEFYAFRARQA